MLLSIVITRDFVHCEVCSEIEETDKDLTVTPKHDQF